MKPATREWVAKAEEDFLAALDLARRRKRPVWNSVCFHTQQCAEKYLKARLQEAGLHIPRTHDLEVLLDQVAAVEPLWTAFKPAAQNLTDFAVAFRYPGDNATKADARQALKDCKAIRREIRAGLGLHN
jgi:HEPN domain-containing protein